MPDQSPAGVPVEQQPTATNEMVVQPGPTAPPTTLGATRATTTTVGERRGSAAPATTAPTPAAGGATPTTSPAEVTVEQELIRPVASPSLSGDLPSYGTVTLVLGLPLLFAIAVVSYLLVQARLVPRDRHLHTAAASPPSLRFK